MEYHPVVKRIKDFLDERGITYKAFEHDAVRTSEEAALVRPEYSLSQGCKALIVRIKKRNIPKSEERDFVQIVVPGDSKFDPKKVREALNTKDIRFATEEEVRELTDGVEPGGVPPFGNLFGLRVLVDSGVFAHEETIFNAGDRRYSIAIATDDYKRAVQPQVTELV